MTKNKKLSIVKQFNDKNIKFFALGGLGEVGKNMLLNEDEIIVIDSGVLFLVVHLVLTIIFWLYILSG